MSTITLDIGDLSILNETVLNYLDTESKKRNVDVLQLIVDIITEYANDHTAQG